MGRDPAEWTCDQDGNPEYIGPEKTEPDCMACYDSGSVTAAGLAAVVLRRRWVRCPSCHPGRLAHWAFVARWWVRGLLARLPILRRRAGADLVDEPPF